MTRSDHGSGQPPTEQPPAEEDFLSRWSRRKQGLQEAADPPARPEQVPAAPAAEPEADPPSLSDDDMPPLESIDQSRDVSPFLSEGVSEKLRRQALRRLFSLPGFNVRDGLDDYDEDYRSFAALGDIITSDMKFDQERLERLAEERRAAQQDESEHELAQAPEPRQGAAAAGQGVDEGDAEEEI